VVSKQATGEGGSNENTLAPIAEVECVETPEPVPSEFFVLMTATQSSNTQSSCGHN
jgi:hypothetical protein